jgi:hypothetical protein
MTSAEGRRRIRYVFKCGIAIADDMVRNAMAARKLPLNGAYVVRMRKPVPCIFFTFGHGGIMLPDTGLSVIGDRWNHYTRPETYALAWLMHCVDPECKFQLRSNWMLIDLDATEGRILKQPTDEEIALLGPAADGHKITDRELARRVSRVRRRRTTSGADIPDGREDDSDRSPDTAFLDEMARREEKQQKQERQRKRKCCGAPPPFVQKLWKKVAARRLAREDPDGCASEPEKENRKRAVPETAAGTAPGRIPERPSTSRSTAPQRPPPRPSRQEPLSETEDLRSNNSIPEDSPCSDFSEKE